MSAAAPGQAAYEAWHAKLAEHHPVVLALRKPQPWDLLSAEVRAEWEAAATAAVAAYIELNGADPVDARAVIAEALAPQPYDVTWATGLAAREPDAADGVLLSDYLRQRGRPGVAAMVEEAERAAREPGAAGGLPELRWAPYQEFGIPDPAAETHEPPAVAVTVGATGYRGNDIIVYWTPAEPQPAPGLAALIEDWRDTLDELADMSDDAHPRGKAGRETETGVLRTVIAQAEKISGGAAPGLAEAVTEARAHQALIAEILSHFGPSGSGHTARVGQVQITRWLKRAGIEQP